jgi:metal-responsive CopG/Arc/MetJ family transcriptional regulator
MKTAISIPDELFGAAETVAKRLGVSRSELYATALAAYIREHQGDARRATIDRVLAATPPPRLDPALARIQSLSLGPDEGALEDWVDVTAPRRGRKRTAK